MSVVTIVNISTVSLTQIVAFILARLLNPQKKIAQFILDFVQYVILKNHFLKNRLHPRF